MYDQSLPFCHTVYIGVLYNWMCADILHCGEFICRKAGTKCYKFGRKFMYADVKFISGGWLNWCSKHVLSIQFEMDLA